MADNEGQPQRKRARQACIPCNARRVKCNVTETQPCHNCLAGNLKCETRESRRGKHPRPSKKRHSVDSSISRATGSRSQHEDDVAGAHVLASLHRNTLSDGAKLGPADAEPFVPEPQLNPQQEVQAEDDGAVFLGETTSLRYVHDQATADTTSGPSPGRSVKLRYSVPNAARAESLIPEWEAERRRQRIHFLKQDGAFSLPSPVALEGLLKAYFQWFHPCFAVVDEMEVWNEYRQGKLSILLLQAMLFIGILHCDDEILELLGEGTRHRAKYIFYNHAKDIYDAEYEPKKLTVIQAVFLMSFWRAGALLEKDTRHWLGAAISLAQTKALHRSAGPAESQTAKLRRRLWWSLYTRDRQCSAALGLPNRVRDEDCDFECLEKSDFEFAFNPNVPKKSAEEYAAYAVGMTELAKLLGTFVDDLSSILPLARLIDGLSILGDVVRIRDQYKFHLPPITVLIRILALGQIVHTGYLPNKFLDVARREQMKDQLVQWKQRLPPTMQPDNDLGEPPGFQANMQHLAYNNLLILLYRQGYIGSEGESGDIDGNIALNAAARSTRIVEDMLSDGTLRHGTIHTITNLFNTLCIHTVQLRRSEGTTRTVAEHRAKLSLHGLQELQKTWELTNWVLQLFFHYLDRSTAARLRMQDDGATLAALGGALQKANELAPNPQPSATIDPLSQGGILSPIAEGNGLNMTDPSATAATPWSWTSEEVNQFLFSQIENEFAFGEGEMLDWSPEDIAFNTNLFQPDAPGPANFMP